MKMKEKLHKWLFPEKDKLIASLEVNNDILKDDVVMYKASFEKELAQKYVGGIITRPPTEEDVVQYCLKTLGIPLITFSDVDDNGKPPHYLSLLSDAERKSYVAHMETIFSDEKFQTVVSYIINLLGNYAIQKADESQMRNGRVGIIAIRTLMGEFLDAHREYVDSRKQEDTFDPLAVMPS